MTVLSAARVANFFLDIAEKENHPLTMLKLMKLVYIAHGWCLAVLDRDALNGEQVEAWQYGPVIESLYHEFKHFSHYPINSRATEFSYYTTGIDDSDFDFKVIEPHVDRNDEDAKNVLDFVWGVYKQFNAKELVNMTHEAGSPWSEVWDPSKRHIEIPVDMIKGYYQTIATRYLSREAS